MDPVLTPATPRPAPRPRLGRRWIAAIVVFLAANVTASVLLATLAHDGAGSRTTAAYDETTVGDRQVAAQAEHARQLGWQVVATLSHGELDVAVRDASGAPVAGATVHVRGAHRAHAEAAVDADLAARDTGYAGPGPTRAGWYDLRVAVARGDVHDVRELAVLAK